MEKFENCEFFYARPVNKRKFKKALEEGKEAMLKLADEHKNKMFNFEEFDQKVFDNEFTYTIQCFAMALYIDKKIELCLRRKYDLTPDCFKNVVDKE